MKKILTLACLGLLFLASPLQAQNDEHFVDLLKKELKQQMKELSSQKDAPYYMNYRVIDAYNTSVSSSYGAILAKQSNHTKTFLPQIRIGSPKLDNFRLNPMGIDNPKKRGEAFLPLTEEGGDMATKQAIWQEVNARYKYAVKMYQQVLSNSKTSVESSDKADWFSPSPVETHYEKPLPADRHYIDKDEWAKRLSEVSAVFIDQPHFTKGNVSISYKFDRRYFLDSEGTCVVQNLTYARIVLSAECKTEDGSVLPLNKSFFAFDAKDLPDNATLIACAKDMVKTLKELYNAPLAEPFTGPALLSGPAAGVFFHEIFGHRTEGQRMKNDSDGQTFKKLVGKEVLSPELNVYDDPSLKRYAGTDLNGYYLYDEQGVKGQRVDIAKKGVLNEFLMSRTPIDGHPKSNGHGRASYGFDPVSRQSNLVIETVKPYTDEQLCQMLREEAKSQGKEYGYYFKEVTSGFALTDKKSISSFNVTPLVVYKIYVDGRPNELVRGVNLIGTPLSIFSNIKHAGDTPAVFTGMCGAESGWVPVTASAPSIFVKVVETQSSAKSQDLPAILPAPTSKK